MGQSIQICKVCANSKQNTEFNARVMMFGSRDEFKYLGCSECGCLQLIEIPDSLEKYYPSDYYSFKPKKESIRNSIDLLIKKHIALYRLNKSILGRWLLFLNKRYLKWLNPECNLNFESRILDVAMGNY
ncbi:MAG: hypothetical protein ACJA08_002030 [Cyclobacteriaceae bacterium]|jgi:hypothetical protein